MKKIITSSIGIIFLFVCTINCYGYFDSLIKKTDINITIGSWENINTAFSYLNNKNPKILNINGIETSILKNVAQLLWNDIIYNDEGKIVSGNLRTEYNNYDNINIKEIIDGICDYISSFLKINEQGLIYYPDNSNVESQNINFNTILQPDNYEDFLSVFLSANLTDGYWAPITYSVTLEADSDISDFSLEILYTPPENKDNMFSYQCRIIDENLYNTTVSDKEISKDKNNLVLIKADYQYEISAIKYINNNNFINDTITHKLKEPSFGNWSRFITGANLGISKKIKNIYNNYEQTLKELSPKSREGMIIIGKPDGNKVELRLSITNRGQWDKPSFDIMPIIIRISRGNTESGNSNIEIIPKITIKAVQGDVWY